MYFRSTRGSLKLVLWPTSTRTALYKVRIHGSIHGMRESSAQPTGKIPCKTKQTREKREVKGVASKGSLPRSITGKESERPQSGIYMPADLNI